MAPDRSGLASQDEEGSLEGVFHVLLLVLNPPTDAEDHWPVPPHQRLEGGLALLLNKAVQQLPVRERIGRRLRRQTAKMFDDDVQMPGSHAECQPQSFSVHLYTATATAKSLNFLVPPPLETASCADDSDGSSPVQQTGKANSDPRATRERREIFS